jgi:hypothetical protein
MTRALVVLMLITSGTTAWSQTPVQFSKLLTTSTDYTCGGTIPCATWPMPPIPAPGGSWLDPTFGTTTWRLAVPPANKSGKAIPAYNRVQAWNSNNTLMFMVDMGNAGLDLYDATTTPPTPINRITTDLGPGIYPDAGDGDALWAFTDPHRIYFQAAAGSAYGRSLMYVDVSACTPSNCVLHPTIVHTVSCTTDAVSNPELGAGVEGNKIETGSGAQGGMFDNTDTYFSFTCDKVDRTGRHEIDFIRFNRMTNTVEHQQKWYTLCPGAQPQGCAAYWSSGRQGRGVIRMNQHPDHRYIAVIWQAGATVPGSGTSSPPTHINITRNVLTVTARNTLQPGTEAKFHNLSAATYLNNQFVIVTSATNSEFTAIFPHADDDQAITSGTITGLSCAINANWVRGCGVEVFDDHYNFLGPAAAYPGHMDTGFDVNGIPVMVTVGSHHGDGLDERAIGISSFATLSTTAVIEKRVLLPCSFTRQPTCNGTFLGSKPGHISMTGTWGSLPGYGLYSSMMVAGPVIGFPPRYPPPTTLGTAVTAPGTVTVTPASMSRIGAGIVSTVDTGANMESVTWTAVTPTTATATFTKAHSSTAAVNCLSCGETGFGAMENFAVKIDTNAPDGSNAVFWRIGRTMAIRDNYYNAEPHTAVNRDFTQIIWGSTWNADPPNSSAPIYGFWTTLNSPKHAGDRVDHDLNEHPAIPGAVQLFEHSNSTSSH